MTDKPGVWMEAGPLGFPCGECRRKIEQGEPFYYLSTEQGGLGICKDCAEAVAPKEEGSKP